MESRRLVSAADPLFGPAFSLYETAFPLHEQRRRATQEAVMADPLYHFDVVVDGGDFAGVLLWWAFGGYSYVEHFAINPALRGRSLGSASLKLFCDSQPLVVLEIDPPVDTISRRRESFYTRLGFHANPYPHAHPAYQRQFPPHELVVMSHPRPLRADEYARFAGDLAQVVMADAEQ